MAVVGVRTALGAATQLLPDLPGPFPCAVMLMQAAPLAEDLPYGQVVVAVGASAPEVATPPRKRCTRPAAVMAQAAIPSAPRRQTLAHRSPTIHAARSINEAVVLPVRATSEAHVRQLVSASGVPMGPTTVEGLAAPQPRKAAAAAGKLLPLSERALPTLAVALEAAVAASSPLRPSRSPSPARNSEARVPRASPSLTAGLPLHGAPAARFVASLVVPARISMVAEALDGPKAAKPNVLVPAGRGRAAAAVEGGPGLTIAPALPEVRAGAPSPALGARSAMPLPWQEPRPEVLTPSREDTVRVHARTNEPIPKRPASPRVEVVPILPRVAVLQGLREVGPLGPTSTGATSVDAQATILPVVVPAVRHASPTGLARAQLLQGPRALSAPITRLQLPAGPLREVAISLRTPSPRLEVASGPTSLAGLAITAIPARRGAVRPASVLRTQVPTALAAARLPTDGSLLGVLPA